MTLAYLVGLLESRVLTRGRREGQSVAGGVARQAEGLSHKDRLCRGGRGHEHALPWRRQEGAGPQTPGFQPSETHFRRLTPEP